MVTVSDIRTHREFWGLPQRSKAEIHSQVYEATRLYGFKRINLDSYLAEYLCGLMDEDEFRTSIIPLVDDPDTVLRIVNNEKV